MVKISFVKSFLDHLNLQRLFPVLVYSIVKRNLGGFFFWLSPIGLYWLVIRCKDNGFKVDPDPVCHINRVEVLAFPAGDGPGVLASQAEEAAAVPEWRMESLQSQRQGFVTLSDRYCKTSFGVRIRTETACSVFRFMCIFCSFAGKRHGNDVHV